MTLLTVCTILQDVTSPSWALHKSRNPLTTCCKLVSAATWRSKGQIPLGSSRHVTTRYLAHACSHRIQSWRYVTRRVSLVVQHGSTRSSGQARLARHVFRGVAKTWTEVDMSTSLFPEVVPETDANPEHRRLNLYMRALLLLRRPPCWNKHG